MAFGTRTQLGWFFIALSVVALVAFLTWFQVWSVSSTQNITSEPVYQRQYDAISKENSNFLDREYHARVGVHSSDLPVNMDMLHAPEPKDMVYLGDHDDVHMAAHVGHH